MVFYVWYSLWYIIFCGVWCFMYGDMTFCIIIYGVCPVNICMLYGIICFVCV